MLSTTSKVTERVVVDGFYAALRDKDVPSLLDLLASDVVVTASVGMPAGVGGVHVGAWNAVVNLWTRIHRSFDVAPIPETTWQSSDGTVIVHGWYRGAARRTGQPICAEFVHLFRLENDRVVELRQVTDTASWGAP